GGGGGGGGGRGEARVAGSAPAGAPPARSPPGGAESSPRAWRAAASAFAARTSRVRVSSPAAAPASEGRTSTGCAVGRLSAAARPIPGETARPATPQLDRRKAATPITPANTAGSTRIPVTSAVLSLDPNVEIAKFFSAGGARSIAALPTATTGEPCGPVIPATSWPTPSATAAVIRPVSMPVVNPGRA